MIHISQADAIGHVGIFAESDVAVHGEVVVRAEGRVENLVVPVALHLSVARSGGIAPVRMTLSCKNVPHLLAVGHIDGLDE